MAIASMFISQAPRDEMVLAPTVKSKKPLRRRWKVLLLVLCVLLLLDLGRSLYARLGYAEPAEPWQEAPYEALAWPPGADLAADATLGQRVYVERCAICHGPEGRGDGPAAPSFVPRPRDFALGEYKYKSTPEDQPASAADLRRTVTDGLPASAMPYWRDILSEAEIEAVVAYIQDFSLFAGDEADPQAIAIPARPAPDAASLARGQALYGKSCAECHAADGRGGGWLQVRKKGDYPVPIRDLTVPWSFRGGHDPEQLWLRLTTGLRPGPMPEYATALSDIERWDLVNYTLSLGRRPAWQAGGELAGPGQQADLVKRGEYLLHTEMCGLCHTQINSDMIYSGDKYYLAGGMGIEAYPQGTYVSRNLTPDIESGLGAWSTAEIADAIRTGRTPERRLNMWGMPWMFFHSFEPDDALAIASYLKSRPAVKNHIPAPLRYGFVETLFAKTLHSAGLPPIGNPRRLTYKAGNFGQTEPGVLPRDWPQQVLIGAQWLLLLGGLVAFVMAAPAGRRWPRGMRGWTVASLTLAGLGIVSGSAWTMYETPVLAFVPPAKIGEAVAATIPAPDPGSFAKPEQAALATRGRYLFTVTSCAFCHGSDGSGGQKVSMRAFGSLWVRNITPDRETGIGAWSDSEIARAIRSGVSRQGGVLHWQGMVWDHLSNLAEEDVRALIVYLRSLPPVRKQVPAASPPSADDCSEYTFFLVPSSQPGCG